MSQAIKPIETIYQGYRFRSRLEARWAVFFDALGVKWEYEREGFDLGGELGYYLPDFYLPKFNTWAEVKPEIPDPQSSEYLKLQILAESQPGPCNGVFLGQIGQWDNTGCTLNIGAFRDTDQSCLEEAIPITLDSFDAYWNMQMRCPVCQFEYVHFGDADNLRGNDNYETGTGLRGDVIRIPMYCESEHYWNLEFGFHKGYTFVRVAGISERLDDFLLICAQGNNARLEQAINAAKSARFEHGEKGAPR
jgi:hypothetical protein